MNKTRFPGSLAAAIMVLALFFPLLPVSAASGGTPDAAKPPASRYGAGSLSMAPAAAVPIPNIKVEGRPNDSGWVSAESDGQGNLYLAFEYVYATGGSCPDEGCYALVAGKSRDNGRSWDLRYVVAENSESARRPSLAVDAAGRLYIAFEHYFNGPSGLRWYAAAALSTCPREVAAWTRTSWNTPYALVPGGTAADAGGDGNDVYLAFAVAHEDDGFGDRFLAWSTDGGDNWTADFLSTTAEYHYRLPTLSVGAANVVSTYIYTWNHRRNIYRGAIGTLPASFVAYIVGSLTRPIYADADSSGSYHYLVYERWPDAFYGHTYIRYSVDDGSSFSGEVAVDATAPGHQRYPAVAAGGANVRAAYVNGTGQMYLRTSADNGQTWSAAYDLGGTTTVAGDHLVGVAYHPVGGSADGKHPIAVWVDSRDAGGEGSNLYLGTIDEPPVAGGLSWPADGAALTTYAPTLSWTAGSDLDGDTLRYAWLVSTTNPPGEGDRVGGPSGLLYALPYETRPGTTYYWKVQADDGYQTADTAVRSFTTGSEHFSGSPPSFAESFGSDPANWTRAATAGRELFESAPLLWTAWPADKWELVAYEGRNAVRALYDADNADYCLTSPALDLRGSAWAYFNGVSRGSSESGHDIWSLEVRPADAGFCWAVLDGRSGEQDAGWASYARGSVDLGAYAHTDTGQVRLRFTTDAGNHGGVYGTGWYADDLGVARQTEWAWQNAAPYYYGLQTTEEAFTGYTDNLVDQLYSPYVLLPDNDSWSIRLVLGERYDIAAGDEAAIWILDAAAGTWAPLAAYSGIQGSFVDRTVEIPDGYKGRQVVVALVLRSDGSGALQGPEEQGGFWDVDGFRLEEYNPTAVKLTALAAAPAAGGILVTWETASEHDNAGFNLYRSATVGDIGVRLNDLLIPSDTPGGDQGASYAFLDGAALPGVTYYYTLEDVDLSGHATPHGPVAVMPWWVYMPLVER